MELVKMAMELAGWVVVGYAIGQLLGYAYCRWR
jgi:hypothetical protein